MSTWEYSPRAGVTPVAKAGASARSEFIRKTYLHLAGAIGVFTALEVILLQLPITKQLIGSMASSRLSWGIVLVLFMGVGWIADKWARSSTSKAMQYAGLGLYVVAEAIIFLPLLYIAAYLATPDVLPAAAILTLTLFAGLTGTMLITKKDFSFLRSALMIGGMVAIGLVFASLVFGFTLGLIFAGAMIILAGISILYTTSNILHHYNTEQYVAASLSLFAGVALMFYYILYFLLSLSRD